MKALRFLETGRRGGCGDTILLEPRKILKGISGGTRGRGCRKGNLGGGKLCSLQPRKIFRALFLARDQGKGNLFSEPIKKPQNHFLGEWGSERHFFSSQKSPHPSYSLSLSVAILGFGLESTRPANFYPPPGPRG